MNPQFELLVVRSNMEAPVEEHQTVLEVAEVVQCLCFLVNGLHEVSVDLQGGFGVLQGVVGLAQQDVALASGDQSVFLSWIEF